MARLIYSSLSELDLFEIWSYIAGDNIEQADRLVDRIEAAGRMLIDQPMAGRPREELRPSLRSFVVGNYLIYYQVVDEGILIVRIVHGARDVDTLF